MANNIRINESNRTLEITKSFQKKASFFGSNEFEELNKARTMFPEYAVVVKSVKKAATYKGLTVNFMKTFIISTNDNEALNELLVMTGESNSLEDTFKRVPYGTIRKWFLEKYPQFKITKKEEKEDNIMSINAA